MKKLFIHKHDFLLILLGTTLISLGIQWFMAPIGLVAGGISGLGIVIQKVTNGLIPIAVTNLVCNIPLFIISIKQRGFEFVKKSLYAVLLTSIMLAIIACFNNPFLELHDILITALFGGSLIGIGIGFVLRSGATTGGTDMLAAIIKFRRAKFPIPKLMLSIDAIIIIIGMFTFGQRPAMYAIISVLISTKSISMILEGGYRAKAVFIITTKGEEIANAIGKNIHRGSTQFKGRGTFSKDIKEVIFTVISEKQVPQLKQLIKTVDAKAFVTIADVREVVGEGFVKENALL
ncbi:hypothetical protein AN396_07380 [Candidatus Epulonipiscium fishelsonii]|uniref:Uncharacterized protein n=1 Tax=Candidatus Epulonipiscium fishelsonii TaxID=77094 RepID=A0ACC8XBR2_9FIRM|nr:hypothetical protein AN396_07380 [Epulopiscium sp. SCG-B11WGA-EpuloA1]